MLFAFLFILAGAETPLMRKDKKHAETKDSTVLADTLGPDTLLSDSASGEPDTTLMDSMQLAIYKHNKMVDDSIRLDSMNRAKSTGVDAPVKFSAQDSMV